MTSDESLIGELLAAALDTASTSCWGRDRVDAACARGRAVGVDPATMLRLLELGRAGTLLSTAPAVRRAYSLSVRDFDRVLRRMGFSAAQRRAALGLPPA